MRQKCRRRSGSIQLVTNPKSAAEPERDVMLLPIGDSPENGLYTRRKFVITP